MFTLIAAMDEASNIGKNGLLPWHLSEDLKIFKQRTLGHTIVMGKTTFLGMGKPLPERKNLIVTHDVTLKAYYDGIETIHDFTTFLQENRYTKEEIFICGGAGIYMQAMAYCDKLIITEVDGVYDADISFPHFDRDEFDVVSIEEHVGFRIKTLIRKEKHV
ncbi:MAG: dihydrofolate reductase [Erysipelotrichales bacterium]|nr:MAG: dihydrofolate reductase [Erysipelotrichales bacterium]